MIPLLQNDYYKYIQMFRGNFLKGASLFRSLLNDPTTREQLLVNLPALSAVFSDFSKTEANRLCYDILSEKSYFEDAVMYYLQGIEATTHSTMTELIDDEDNIISLLQNEDTAPIFKECLSLYQKVLKKQATLDLLKEDANTNILLDDLTLSVLSSYATMSTTNLYTSYNTFVSSISSTTCEFDANETYYSFSPTYTSMFVDDETRQAFLPVLIRTRVGSTSTYYYYPAVFKYDIASAEWSILHVSMTETKITSSYKSPQGVAYDPDEDLVYLFYRQDTTVQMNCDIIKASTGVAVMTEVDIGAVGSTSYLTGYYCCFDKENKVAKFVWDTYAITSTSTSYGWLYGCSINKSGIVWQGVVATPRNDRSSCYSSEMVAVAYPYKCRSPKGAYVCSFSNSSSSSTAITLGFIVHSGAKMTSKYIQIASNSDYADYYSPSTAMMTENGLFLMYCTSAVYVGSTYNLVLAIDIPRGKILKAYTSSTSYTYTLYLAPLIRKAAIKHSTSSDYIIIGEDESGNLIEMTTNTLPSVFSTNACTPIGTERYKYYPSGSSYWYLYDCKGGFAE